MKKLLLTIVIVLLCVLAYIMVFNSLKMGKFKIKSVADIKSESLNLDNTLKKATELTAQTYPQTKDKLNTSINNLKIKKEQYLNKIANMPNSDTLEYMQIDNYEKEFLWTKIGSYATKENIELELDIVDIKDNNYYDLEFVVVGRYSDVSDFIYSIENDDNLGFRIENFSMNPYTVSETTTIKNAQGATTYSQNDQPYDLIKEKSYARKQVETKQEEKEEKASNSIFNTKDNKAKETTESKTTESQPESSNSISTMYSPDRVQATFTVTKVNVNLN